MAQCRHVLAERDPDRQEGERAACDRAADDLHLDGRGADPLTARIALPPAIDPAALAAFRPGTTTVDLAGATMGTTWSVRAVLPPGFDVAGARAAIERRLDGIVAEMSQWRADSLLSRYNRAAAGTWIALPPDFAHVMANGLALAATTDGAFDPTLGRITALHGLGPDPAPFPPDPAALNDARAASGWRRVAWNAAARRLYQPGGLWLDLSGIAKGYAVDAVADLLGGVGVVHMLVEIGGELAGRGFHPEGRPWWVDLEAPPGVALAPLRLGLHGQAVATSGDYRRGRHMIDPASAQASAGLTAVTVIHQSAMLADAWATALTVFGPVDGMARATAEGLAARFVGDDGGEWLSPALVAMLED